MISTLLDNALDRSIIGGYTNVGYQIRQRGWSASELRRWTANRRGESWRARRGFDRRNAERLSSALAPTPVTAAS